MKDIEKKMKEQNEIAKKQQEALTEAVGDIMYVAGALSDTREERLRDDLMAARRKIVKAMNGEFSDDDVDQEMEG